MANLEPWAATLIQQSSVLGFGFCVEARFLRTSDWAVWVRHWARAARWTSLQRRLSRHLWGIRGRVHRAARSPSSRCWRSGEVSSALPTEAGEERMAWWECWDLSSLWHEKHRVFGPAWASGSGCSHFGPLDRVGEGCGPCGPRADRPLAPIDHLWISAAANIRHVCGKVNS